MNDDKLILYYYNDGLSKAEMQRIDLALQNDPALARRYRDLQLQMKSLEVPAATPAPAASVMRWRDTINKVADIESGAKPTARSWSFAWIASAAAVLVIGIAIGMGLDFVRDSINNMPQPLAQVADPASSTVAQDRHRALTRGLTEHLKQTQGRLASLNEAGPQERARLIARIIEQNQLFVYVAEKSGATDIARLLRAFEQPLTAMANESRSITSNPMQQDQLSFELAVTLTKLAQESSDKAYEL